MCGGPLDLIPLASALSLGFQFSAFSFQLSAFSSQLALTSLTASFFTHGNTLEHFKLQLMRLQNIIVGI